MRPAPLRTSILVLAVVFATSLSVLPLQSTWAAQSLTVNTTADLAPPCSASALSLRCAITTANAAGSAGATITFQIPAGVVGCVTGVCTLRPTNPLPTLTASNTTINGYTQSGARANLNPLSAGDNAIIRIRLDGFRVGKGHVGLNLAGSHNLVEGLSVTGFLCVTYAGYCMSNGINGTYGTNGVGIYVAGGTASNNVIQGNFIGVAPDGKTAGANSLGINVDSPGLSGTTIGSSAPAAANLISGNQNDGLDLVSSGNLVIGNLVGTTAAGTKALANAGFGVADLNGSSNTIGGAGSGFGNDISGNGGGVELIGATGDTVQGNLIGTNAAGTSALGNNLGVGVDYTSGPNTIGGTSSGSGNVISGNTGTGIAISSASGTVIEENLIGTNPSGTAVLGNGYNGVEIQNQSSNTVIGGTASGSGNVIGGNQGDGVVISQLYHATGNLVEGNFIGVSAAGVALPNTGNGVSFDLSWALSTTDSGATVGGTATGAGNVIANNNQSGVAVGTAGVASIRVAITRNSISANGGPGIDLAPQGTVNCTTSPPGPNDYLPCPVIQQASTTQISGTACPGYTVEVFIASGEADDQGHGEGKTFLGSAIASGTGGTWTLSLSPGQLSAGQLVTATATGTGSGTTAAETSEFAANVTAVP
jgi:parallel beta-helix repeat protein